MCAPPSRPESRHEVTLSCCNTPLPHCRLVLLSSAPIPLPASSHLLLPHSTCATADQREQHKDLKGTVCIYSPYLNKFKTIQEGRRISMKNAVEDPTAWEILEVLPHSRTHMHLASSNCSNTRCCAALMAWLTARDERLYLCVRVCVCVCVCV